ncbi:MAG: ABC transporter substrate-binding protein [Paludibacteraceae bacterium]|nr:ABC transporter substrate-binding protein [Paludibacteraceae bacterium]
MLKIKFYIALCWFGLVCVACQPTTNTSITDNTAGFTIDIHNDSTTITIYSPWQKGKVMQQLAFNQAYERIVCTSATHMGFISELGMMDKVVGVCRPNRVYNLSEEERERITDIGDDMQPSMEKILLLNPDLVILYTYAQGDPIPAQVEALGVPILYCNEWTETTPLARAEWIRLFGAIFGCSTKADSIFASVKDAYEAKRLSGEEAKGRSILSGMSWRGTWYVPAGGTFMGNLFCDAEAQYRYADNPSTSSIPLTMEQALQDFAEADVWVGCNASSLEELRCIDEKHTWFKSYQTGQVYNFYRRTLPSGANDFWESGTVHPERILQDLQSILQGDTSALYYAAPLY